MGNVISAVASGNLVEALVRVQIAVGSIVVRVIVPATDEWARDADLAARVTVEAVRARLLERLEGDRE
jgi:hypothetical protein